jgi:hypothetical protein
VLVGVAGFASEGALGLTARRLNPGRWALTFAVAAEIQSGNQYYQVTIHKKEYHMSLKEVQAKIQWAGEEAWLEGNVDALKEAYAEDYVSHRPPLSRCRGARGS